MKQLRNAESLLTNETTGTGNILGSLRLSTEQLMKNIRTLEQNVNEVATHLQNRTYSRGTIDTIRKALRTLPKQEKNYFKERKDWDMKKLYAEVFKVSYRRNELKTPAQIVS